MTLPDESRDVIGKSQEIWNWEKSRNSWCIHHRMATDNAKGYRVKGLLWVRLGFMQGPLVVRLVIGKCWKTIAPPLYIAIFELKGTVES